MQCHYDDNKCWIRFLMKIQNRVNFLGILFIALVKGKPSTTKYEDQWKNLTYFTFFFQKNIKQTIYSRSSDNKILIIKFSRVLISES